MFQAWVLALCIAVSPDGAQAQFQLVQQFNTKVECEQKLLSFANNPAVNNMVCIGMLPKITSV
jgi:hypothetical protein